MEEQETNKVIDPILAKKLDGYRVFDFVVEHELTVTITLSEYRELVSTKATTESKVNEACSARWKVERERDDLKNELAQVRSDLAATHDRNAELLQENDQLLADLAKAREQLKAYQGPSEASTENPD